MCRRPQPPLPLLLPPTPHPDPIPTHPLPQLTSTLPPALAPPRPSSPAPHSPPHPPTHPPTHARREYTQFRVSSDGELLGVGLLIANEPVHGRLLVLAPIRGGPAERAGVRPGDEVMSIDGLSTEGWTGEMAAKVLRGQVGRALGCRAGGGGGGERQGRCCCKAPLSGGWAL
jgi:hypothetical protein